MIKKNGNDIKEAFQGTQGIKTIYKGDNLVYERQGGFIYITVENEKKE